MHVVLRECHRIINSEYKRVRHESKGSADPIIKVYINRSRRYIVWSSNNNHALGNLRMQTLVFSPANQTDSDILKRFANFLHDCTWKTHHCQHSAVRAEFLIPNGNIISYVLHL